MSAASGSETIRRLSTPDNLSSTNARVSESLYGDEVQVESETEQVPARSDEPVKKKTWKWPSILRKFPRFDLFRNSRTSTVLEPFDEFVHQDQAVSLIPGMLRLPVEIRNQIYNHIFEQRVVSISRISDQPHTDMTPLADAITEHRGPERPKAIKSIRIVMYDIKKSTGDVCRKVLNGGLSYDGIPGRKPQPIEGVNWETSLNSLLLTCKTIYNETAPMLYGTTVFYFEDAQRIRAFLNTVSDRNLAFITKLHVQVRAYGLPTEAEDVRWEQKHVKCWTKIFASIAKKMTNLRVMRVTLTVNNITDALKYAFRPIQNNTDWKTRASYMLMLRDLSALTKLEDLRVSIRTTEDIRQEWEYMTANVLYNMWMLANIHPLNYLQDQLRDLHHELADRMHDGLEKAMTEVARSKDPNESFAPVALATREYIDYCRDPVGDMLARRHGRD